MRKIVRSTYPLQVSVGLLILIFFVALFLSPQVFYVEWQEIMAGTPVYLGMILVSCAVVVMVLVIWEEFLFPVKIKPGKDGIVFRNHRNKINTQLLIYLIIPAAFILAYFNFEVRPLRFFTWAALCIILPVAVKLISGVKNYNDFLKLSDSVIEFKNNKKSGVFALQSIQRITLIRDENNVLHKIQLSSSGSEHLIDLDEMELELFLDAIDQYVASNYKLLVANARP